MKRTWILAVVLVGLPGTALASGYELENRITAPVADTLDRYASDVAVDGDLAVVGARRYDVGGVRAGGAYVYRWVAGAWTLEQEIVSSTPQDFGSFGFGVTCRDDVIVVGAPGESNGRGAAYVFRYDGSMWVEEQRLTASDGGQNDDFGLSVDVDGDVMVVGTLGPGRAYVFRYDGSSWIEEQMLLPGDSPDLAFGYSVALRGDTALVGSERHDGVGAAYVYRYDGAAWNEEQKLFASDGGSSDRFGQSVDLDEGVAVVGAFLDNAPSDSGSAYVFRYDGAAWNEEQKLIASDAEANDWFGVSVAIDGDLVAIGASRANAVYTFRHAASSWTETQILTPTNLGSYGALVSARDNRIVVGAPDENAAVGAAYFYLSERCLEGTVNASLGLPTDVLYVDGRNGGDDRTVEIDSESLVAVTLLRPLAGGTGKFVLHANEGTPDVALQSILPADIGVTCFPLLASQGAAPVIVANNLGKTSRVFESQFFGSPTVDPDLATTTVYFPALPAGTELTFQAVVVDPASLSGKGVSVTNAVILSVMP